MVLHDINQAIAYSHEIIGLYDGKVSIQGVPEEVVTRDSMHRLFGVDLEVKNIEGRSFVLPVDRKDGMDCDGAKYQ